MTDLEQRFHETWLGMVQPVDGLVVSIPVLVDAQCMERQAPETQAALLALSPAEEKRPRAIADLDAFFRDLLGYAQGSFHGDAAIPDELALYVPEGKQTLRPTLALPKPEAPSMREGADITPAARAGAAYEILVWDVPRGLDLDRPEAETGPWHYPPSAKFDRLLRHARVPIGLLTNREVIRLVYAPHGESSGSITFRVDDMASVGGRPILDAFVMLLSANRVLHVAKERALPTLLAESRKRQANVTNALADQVFEALAILLRGFEAAAERDGKDLLDEALAREHDHLYQGLLTVLLRLVFVLYAEDRGLLPTEDELYAQHLSVGALYDQLQTDKGAYPDSMSRRFGAWSRLLALFRTIYLGVTSASLRVPPRRGNLFDPGRFNFLEGWPAGGAPVDPEARADVHVPTLDDETIYRVLDKLLILEGQRLSYRALDVEQIGSVYEALMGYHVIRLDADAVCMRPDRVWLTAHEVLEVPAGRRAKWLKETTGLSAAQVDKISQAIAASTDGKAVLEALAPFAIGGKRSAELARGKTHQLVLQPGHERRRTSSHYTPRSLSAPIVQRTLEPLLACMGAQPPSHLILELKICDPAMGSGAFLVEACRFLAEHVVAAWTREGVLESITAKHGDPLMHARRLVAQRCLYGVDKNAAAVELAKLSLWLVTLAKDLPFTFVDHALRHGDSLVGLDFDQIRSFHWKPGKQLDFCSKELDAALSEAIGLRQRILDLAEEEDPGSQREKERLLWDAQDALERVRLVGDVIVGAFFACEKDKEREKERTRRQDMVEAWLRSGDGPAEELKAMQAEIRERIPVFHWMSEFPEIFDVRRSDPLDGGRVNGEASLDAFLGNPPFAGKNAVSAAEGETYIRWLQAVHADTHGNADIVAHFFRRCHTLLGRHGTIGLIATNTVAQGDTRATGLLHVVRAGAIIYNARTNLPWPGEASVSVAVVHLAVGSAIGKGVRLLDGRSVSAIDSRLQPGAERGDAAALEAMTELWFNGTYPHGDGFVVEADERLSLVETNQENQVILRPFLGGEELNNTPSLASDRYIINFGRRSLAEAEHWPALLRIVEKRVRPMRLAVRATSPAGAHRQKYWWQLSEPRPELYAAIMGLPRCLVNAQVSKHLMFAWQPVDRVFAITLYAYPLAGGSAFATLQARPHEAWTRLLSSSLEDRLRYSASDCFETFPFPQPDPRTVIPALEDIGQRLYDFRAKYMVDENVGLTITYNRLKDPAWAEARILELRRLHEEMDRAVLEAYGWSDVEVPPYCPLTEEDAQKLKRFEDEVIDRLFALNAKRAEEEKLRGVAPRGKQLGKSRKAVAAGADPQLALAKIGMKEPSR